MDIYPTKNIYNIYIVGDTSQRAFFQRTPKARVSSHYLTFRTHLKYYAKMVLFGWHRAGIHTGQTLIG